MSSPVTEHCIITLRPNLDLSNPATPESLAWQETLTTISQQEGYIRLHWGRRLEDERMLDLMIDWESFSAHQNLINAEYYTAFFKNVGKIFTNTSIHHFTPSPPSSSNKTLLTTSPVTETCTIYNCTPTFYTTNLASFQQALLTNIYTIKGLVGVEIGEVIEEIEKDGGGKGKGKACTLLIGWESVEDHVAFRETGVFKDSVGFLRESNGGIVMYHVPFVAF